MQAAEPVTPPRQQIPAYRRGDAPPNIQEQRRAAQRLRQAALGNDGIAPQAGGHVVRHLQFIPEPAAVMPISPDSAVSSRTRLSASDLESPR